MNPSLLQDITRWPRTSSDVAGAPVFGAAQLLRGRWERRSEIITGVGGEEVVSNSQAMLQTPVAEGDYLAEGNLTTHPTPALAGLEVKKVSSSPDLRNVSRLYKAFL